MNKYDHEAFSGSSVQQADEREKALAEGLRNLSKAHGLEFKGPLQIDMRGEFNLFVTNGAYGKTFVMILNKYRPRTGQRHTKYIDESNSWCKMNHFDVQRMLEESGF